MEVARLLCKFVREANSRLKESGDRQGKEMTAPSVPSHPHGFALKQRNKTKGATG